MKIIIDTREQAPYHFDADVYGYPELIERALPTGDYSLPGLENIIAIERKSIDDLLGCLTHDRERFERELARARGLDCFAVVVEADWRDLASGSYKSQMLPQAACQSIAAFMARYRTQFIFAGGRRLGEYATFSLLRQYIQSAGKRLRAIINAESSEAA